jgi:hypothetical protein
VRTAQAGAVEEAVMTPSAPLVAAPGGRVYGVLVAAVNVAVIGTAVRVTRRYWGTLKVALG